MCHNTTHNIDNESTEHCVFSCWQLTQQTETHIMLDTRIMCGFSIFDVDLPMTHTETSLFTHMCLVDSLIVGFQGEAIP